MQRLHVARPTVRAISSGVTKGRTHREPQRFSTFASSTSAQYHCRTDSAELHLLALLLWIFRRSCLQQQKKAGAPPRYDYYDFPGSPHTAQSFESVENMGYPPAPETVLAACPPSRALPAAAMIATFIRK